MADAPKDKKPDDKKPEVLTDSQKIAIENARRDAMTPRNPPTTKTTMGQAFAKGGYVRAADGIAQRGKTRGKYC